MSKSSLSLHMLSASSQSYSYSVNLLYTHPLFFSLHINPLPPPFSPLRSPFFILSLSIPYLPHCHSTTLHSPFTTLSHLQESSDNDDNWTIAMAGATCLEAMARTIEDNIVELILPFVTQVRGSLNLIVLEGRTRRSEHSWCLWCVLCCVLL